MMLVRQQVRVVVGNGSVGMRGRAGAVIWRAVATRGDRPRGLLVPTPCRDSKETSRHLTRGFAAASGPAVGDPEKALKSLAESDGTSTSTATGTDVIANLSTPRTAKGDVDKGKEMEEETKEVEDKGEPNTSTPRVVPKPKKANDGTANDGKTNDEKKKSWREWFQDEFRPKHVISQVLNVGTVVALVAVLQLLAKPKQELAQFQARQEVNKPDDVFKKNVDKAVAQLHKPLVFAETGDLPKQLDRVAKSSAPEDWKKLAKGYLTLGIDMPSKLNDILTSADDNLFLPLVVEGMAGEGKTTKIHRVLIDQDASGVLYVPCKACNSNATIWRCIAMALNLTDVKDEDVGAILKDAMIVSGKVPTIIVDDMHYALEDDTKNTKAFLGTVSLAYDRGTFNFVASGTDGVLEKIKELTVPGLNARIERTDFVSRDLEAIKIPFANFLSVIFAENEANEKASITPSALRPLANDILTLLGPRYLDIQKLHRATSPADAKSIIVKLIRGETYATARNVGPGSICRALVESDSGMFIDTDGKFLGDEPLKGLDGDGKPSDLETLHLVRKDRASVGRSLRPRFRPHHGAAFVAMASVIRDYHPDVKLGKAAVDALAVYDRFVQETS